METAKDNTAAEDIMADAGQTEETSSTLRRRQESKTTPRNQRGLAIPVTQSLTPSPAFSAVSRRSAAAAPMSPTSAPEDFWRLLPVGQNSRRNSSVATTDRQRVRRAPSWMASTPSESAAQAARESPLTPFPPLRTASGAELGEATVEEPGASTHEALPTSSQQDLVADRPNRHQWSLNTAMHGVVLFGQCLVTLAVLSGFLYCAVVDIGSEKLKNSGMPWKYAEPSLGLILATCGGVLALHETRVLSTVAVLYLQALILVMTMGTSLALWIWILTHTTSQIVKGAVVSGVTMLMGTAMIAFFRAALIWWIIEDHGELGGSGFSDEEIGEN
ncbi:hypothetical protein XA68_16795 [Ophiocordyceps unilateralis]|uniref:Uncharacterized protein n=1 Tax=Ophiocordyceps unilateralis TaxID=268505 RepID=A0A2A9PL62_OPHUN|nr:hypothetical protein XA68_16795 [Ophiocordyceps unilateralis]